MKTLNKILKKEVFFFKLTTVSCQYMLKIDREIDFEVSQNDFFRTAAER